MFRGALVVFQSSWRHKPISPNHNRLYPSGADKASYQLLSDTQFFSSLFSGEKFFVHEISIP